MPTCLLAADNRMHPLFQGQSAPSSCCFGAKLPDNVFHHHYCTVDDQPEIDGTKAHQISRNAESRHSGNGEQKRERDRSRDDERGPPVPEKEQQYRYNQQGSFEKVRRHRANRSVHEVFLLYSGLITTPAGSRF